MSYVPRSRSDFIAVKGNETDNRDLVLLATEILDAVSSLIGFSGQKKRENKLSMSYLDVGKESEPYDLFVFAINAKQTKEKYIT